MMAQPGLAVIPGAARAHSCGARLWPLSRGAHPKPFIHPHGGLSLLRQAFLRGARPNRLRRLRRMP
ncbi:MAG: hypothetical protein OD918_09925 [Gammaproteobacteria bacterium]